LALEHSARVAAMIRKAAAERLVFMSDQLGS
jgi:hypothetical protein